MDEISTAQLEARCPAILDEVAAGQEVLVTKRGRPVARHVPPEQPREPAAASRSWSPTTS